MNEEQKAGTVSMIDTSSAQRQAIATKAQIKTREEVVAEQKYEKKLSKKERKARKHGGKKDAANDDPNDPQAQIKKQLKEFYAKQSFTPKYEKKDGKTVEIEYNKDSGLQNAMHIIMKHPNLWIVQYFLNQLNLDFDSLDYKKRTPFSIGIDYQISRALTVMDSTVSLLMERGVNIDSPDEAQQTPYLKLYNNRITLEVAEKLRDRGANINAMSKSGIFVLKIALLRRDDAEITRLIECGANIN